MDSRFRGNDDIRLADDIYGVAKLKWYNRWRGSIFPEIEFMDNSSRNNVYDCAQFTAVGTDLNL